MKSTGGYSIFLILVFLVVAVPSAESSEVSLGGDFEVVKMLEFSTGLFEAEVVGDRLYLSGGALRPGFFEIRDATQPDFPLLDRIESQTSLGDFAIAGNYAYVSLGWGGMLILDISDPNNIQESGTFEEYGTSFYDLQARGKVLFVTIPSSDDFRSIDVSVATNPLELSGVHFPDFGGCVSKFFIADSHAYLPSCAAGLHIVNISNPKSLRKDGLLDPSEDVYAVAAQGDIAYVGKESNTEVVDISDKANPVTIGSINYSGNEFDLSHGVLYMASRNLYLYDTSSPSGPVFAGTFFTDPGSFIVDSDADYIYVGTHQGKEASRLYVLRYAENHETYLPLITRPQ